MQPAANQQQEHRAIVYTFALVAALGSLLFGYDVGLISGAELYLRKDFSLNPLSEEVVVSAILIGGTIGAGISGKLSNAIGRRLSFIIAAIIFAIAAIGFCWLLVPETKGRGLEQIEHYWKNGRHWSFKTSNGDEDDGHSRHVDNSNHMHDGRQRRSR